MNAGYRNNCAAIVLQGMTMSHLCGVFLCGECAQQYPHPTYVSMIIDFSLSIETSDFE